MTALLTFAPQATRAQQPDKASLARDSTAQSLIDARVQFAPNAGLVLGVVDVHGRRVLWAGTLNGPGTPAPVTRDWEPGRSLR